MPPAANALPRDYLHRATRPRAKETPWTGRFSIRDAQAVLGRVGPCLTRRGAFAERQASWPALPTIWPGPHRPRGTPTAPGRRECCLSHGSSVPTSSRRAAQPGRGTPHPNNAVGGGCVSLPEYNFFLPFCPRRTQTELHVAL